MQWVSGVSILVNEKKETKAFITSLYFIHLYKSSHVP
jgi:hypothetical protein